MGLRRPQRILAAALASMLAPSGASLATSTFTGLGSLSAGASVDMSRAYAVSGNGTTVVGTTNTTAGYEAFRWTAASGMVGLGDLPGTNVASAPFYSEGYAVSANGSVVVGVSRGANGIEAFRWDASSGIQGLGDLPGGASYYDSEALGISADGSQIVGHSYSSSGTEAFRWTAATGMQGWGDLPGGNFSSEAVAISADGSTIVGDSVSTIGTEAFRWSAGTGMVGLGELPGGTISTSFASAATAVSANGSVVVGRSDSAEGLQGFIWDAARGMRGLGLGPAGETTTALDVSADGSVVAGYASGYDSVALVWREATGWQPLANLLTDAGIDLGGWVLQQATGVSGNGRTIVGIGVNPAGNTEAFIATLPEPGTGLLLGLGLIAATARSRRRDR